jgi:hypothetical protein
MNWWVPNGRQERVAAGISMRSRTAIPGPCSIVSLCEAVYPFARALGPRAGSVRCPMGWIW